MFDEAQIEGKTYSPDCSGNPFLRGLADLIMSKRDAKKIVAESGIKLQKYLNDVINFYKEFYFYMSSRASD